MRTTIGAQQARCNSRVPSPSAPQRSLKVRCNLAGWMEATYQPSYLPASQSDLCFTVASSSPTHHHFSHLAYSPLNIFYQPPGFNETNGPGSQERIIHALCKRHGPLETTIAVFSMLLHAAHLHLPERGWPGSAQKSHPARYLTTSPFGLAGKRARHHDILQGS